MGEFKGRALVLIYLSILIQPLSKYLVPIILDKYRYNLTIVLLWKINI